MEGARAYQCGSDTACAQVFASMGYDGWALNADDLDITSSSLNAFIDAGGTKPVASNYDTTYTSKYANLGGAVLLAVSETSTATYSKAVALAIAAARDAGVDFDTTPVILSVNGIGTADITDLGASSAAAAVQKLAEENTEIDLVIATGISGLSTGSTTNWAGDQVRFAALSASTKSSTMALGFANGVPTSATITTTTCSSSSKSAFVDGVRLYGTVDYVPIVMLCDTGTAAREECDAGRAAVDAINNKFDGYFDDLLPLTKLEVKVAFFDGTQCKDDSPRTAWEEVSSGFNPVAVRRARWHDVYEIGGVDLDRRLWKTRMSTRCPVNMPDERGRHVRVVDGHERVRPVHVPEPGAPLELRGHGQPGGFSSVVRNTAGSASPSSTTPPTRGPRTREDPERKPPRRGRHRHPGRQVRVVVRARHRRRAPRPPRRGSASTRPPLGLTADVADSILDELDRHRRQDHLHWHAARRSKDSLRADQADGEVLWGRARAPFRVALGPHLL